MDHLQFYPTSARLATKAWQLFKNRHFERVLDPSAGNGDLLAAFPKYTSHRSKMRADAIEIDPARHAALKGHGFPIVGLDFETFESGALYSHIIMNPPFAKGCAHVLHAWDILFDGEIVAIINAETLRNANTRERQLLTSIIEKNGSVQFISDAFMGAGVDREAEVDIALIHLTKRAEANEIVGDIVAKLRRDAMAESLGANYKPELQLALPDKFVENAVIAFKAAVESMCTSVRAEAQASYYAGILGHTMAVRSGQAEPGETKSSVPSWVRNTMSERYDELKDRAWAHVLRSTKVSDKLSTQAQKRLESEFESIKALEFTVSNVYGFLEGLSNSGWEMLMDMACDAFDQITRYHSENGVLYMGWKSNDRHRTCGMRVKMTRFVLPGHSTESYQHSLNYSSEKMLGDYDKVFAALDGKAKPEVTLVEVFKTKFYELRTGDRISSSYFDVRYYPGIGTIHFFPRDKALIDRLNRMVGKHRQWLPPNVDDVSKGFWTQFDRAEKLDPEIRKEFAERTRNMKSWDTPKLNDMLHFDGREDHGAAARAVFEAAASAVFERHGIDVGPAIGNDGTTRLALEMAN